MTSVPFPGRFPRRFTTSSEYQPFAPLAQLDRALDFESSGRAFESHGARHESRGDAFHGVHGDHHSSILWGTRGVCRGSREESVRWSRGAAPDRITSERTNASTGRVESNPPTWNIGTALIIIAAGAVVTFFYPWKWDLWPTFIAHLLVDGTGMILLPLLSAS